MRRRPINGLIMKNKLPILVAGTVVAFLLFVDFMQVKRVRECRREIALKDSLIQREAVSSFRLDYLSSCVATMIHYDRSRLGDVEIIDTSKQVRRLREVVGNGPVLVCRYKETYCPQCVDFALLKIRKMADSFPPGRIVILAQHEENRLFRHFNEQHNPGRLPAFNVGTLDTPLEDLSAPYYFVLYGDMSIGEAFVPEKALPDLTTRYLEIVSRKFGRQVPENR